MAWVVEFENDMVWKDVHKLLVEGELSQDDVKIIKRWIEVIEKEGFNAIKNTIFWYEHALDGDLKGYRASAFSNRGRIIYKVLTIS